MTIRIIYVTLFDNILTLKSAYEEYIFKITERYEMKTLGIHGFFDACMHLLNILVKDIFIKGGLIKQMEMGSRIPFQIGLGFLSLGYRYLYIYIYISIYTVAIHYHQCDRPSSTTETIGYIHAYIVVIAVKILTIFFSFQFKIFFTKLL